MLLVIDIMELSITLYTCLPFTGKRCDLACLKSASLQPGEATQWELAAETAIPGSGSTWTAVWESWEKSWKQKQFPYQSCSCVPTRQRLLSETRRWLGRSFFSPLQSCFPPQPQGQTGNLHSLSCLPVLQGWAQHPSSDSVPGWSFCLFPLPHSGLATTTFKLQGRHTLKHLQAPVIVIV